MIIVIMLQRAPGIGHLIIMINEMLSELSRFLIMGFFVLFGCTVMARLNQRNFKLEKTGLAATFLDMFDGFIGNSGMENYTFPVGQVFITVFVYIS